MTTPIQNRLRSFAVGLLENQGGLIEWPEHEPQGLAVLPRSAAAVLQCPETTTVAMEPMDSGLSVNLASMFVERAEQLFPKGVSTLALKIESLYLKKSSMEEPVARTFAFPNARVKVTGATADRLEYQFWHIAACLESDERWEDLLSVTLNSRTGALLELPDPLANADAHISDTQDAIGPSEAAMIAAAGMARSRAAGFIARLEQRMARDLQRIRSYYQALLDEPLERQRKPFEPQVMAARRQAVELESSRKIDELRQRYALRPSLRPVAVVRLSTPTLAVQLHVQRRDGEAKKDIYWNAITKTLEPLACSRCRCNIHSVWFARDFAPLCKACCAQNPGGH
ncbi:MAG: hypothetical protein ACP5O7_03285 [Phycisphaerae bacterium]